MSHVRTRHALRIEPWIASALALALESLTASLPSIHQEFQHSVRFEKNPLGTYDPR